MTQKDEMWGRVGFKIYELEVMRQCLDYLEGIEMALNRINRTLVSLDDIKNMQTRLADVLIEWNLRNPSALNRTKSLILTVTEWIVLQNGLCLTIGLSLDEVGKVLKSREEFMKVVKHLHRRFELFPVRIAAGLKASGYKLNEGEVERLKRDYRTHDSEIAITMLVKES